VHTDEILMGSREVSEMFLRLPPGTLLGHVYFDDTLVCDVVTTSTFMIDMDSKHAFVHHFHTETISDHFRKGTHAVKLNYPYGRKVKLIIAFVSRTMVGYLLWGIERIIGVGMNK
jgi:hypothetical protein